MSQFLDNLNSNRLCSIDVETTGFVAGFHDVVQVAIIPLNFDLDPDPQMFPFLLDIIPKRPDNIDETAMRINRMKLCDIMVRGVDPYRAQDLFLEWFERLRLGYRKRIAPLGCNYAFDKTFLIDWLGPQTYELCFDHNVRDVSITATYRNDRAGWAGNDFPYPHVNLGGLCNTMRIERTRAHDATDDATVTALVYKRLIQDWM